MNLLKGSLELLFFGSSLQKSSTAPWPGLLKLLSPISLHTCPRKKGFWKLPNAILDWDRESSSFTAALTVPVVSYSCWRKSTAEHTDGARRALTQLGLPAV